MTSRVGGLIYSTKGNKTRRAVTSLQNKPQQASKLIKGMMIGQKWLVGADSLNIILYRRQMNRKTGKEYWRAHSYYSSVANALMCLVDQGVRDTELADLQTVCDRIDQLHGEILEDLSLLSCFGKQEIYNEKSENEY